MKFRIARGVRWLLALVVKRAGPTGREYLRHAGIAVEDFLPSVAPLPLIVVVLSLVGG